eukprot:CAMPEP_0197451894 /NCGR_PEP_ID=MMETSP1175-20131217/30462_1 /TAXON_ID=1003142 /ORGANISM="Triceratium dubium, Strain CCMP147" /LENGTH=109 /DNA_ID=CAMNT_0042984757 /DNA_START=108 /DNA_END=433 /DNA_ORIENTATION=-
MNWTSCVFDELQGNDEDIGEFLTWDDGDDSVNIDRQCSAAASLSSASDVLGVGGGASSLGGGLGGGGGGGLPPMALPNSQRMFGVPPAEDESTSGFLAQLAADIASAGG